MTIIEAETLVTPPTPADGYTLLAGSGSTYVVNSAVYKALPYYETCSATSHRSQSCALMRRHW